MSKFVIGNTVQCIEGGQKGSGWKNGFIFKIIDISGSEMPVYWKAYQDYGVYEDSLKLYSIEDWDP